jgi:hypothetical protein
MKLLQASICVVSIIAVIDAQTLDYSLEDANANSPSFGDAVGPSFYPGKITLHYFGHQS